MIHTKAFCAALKFAAHAQAVSDVRYYLNGVLFEFTRDRLTLVGTDGVRMAVVSVISAAPFEGSFIVSTDSVKHLLALFGKANKVEELIFERTPKGFAVTSTSSTYTPALVDGKFPDYRRVVPPASRAEGFMPALDALQLAAACTALAPLTLKYKNNVPMITQAAGATESVVVRPPSIGVLGIESAFVILMPIRN